MQSFVSPAAISQAEIEVKRSRFIAVIGPAASEDAARRFIADRRLEHPKARHHCSAYRIAHADIAGSDTPRSDTARSDDDGEPAGTAGAPMLAALDGVHAVDAVAVVIRYFGGVLLGTGGLTRAYGGAVREALNAATLVELTRLTVLTAVVDYAVAARAEAPGEPWRVLDASYGAQVRLRLGVPGDSGAAIARLQDLSAGTASIDVAGTTFAPK